MTNFFIGLVGKRSLGSVFEGAEGGLDFGEGVDPGGSGGGAAAAAGG